MSDNERGLAGENLAFVESLWADFLRDPTSVNEEWRRYFETLGTTGGNGHRARLGPSFHPPGLFTPRGFGGTNFANRVAQDRVDQLIRSFRVRGHMIAKIDPLRIPRAPQPELDPSYYGLDEEDLNRQFSSTTIGRGGGASSLRDILSCMRQTYCQGIGVQFMHIDDLQVKNWLQERMEGSENRIELARDQQLRILSRLTDAVVLEEFIQKKYVGAKSFSLEGAETLIPLMELAIQRACKQGVGEIIIGMAHRGRLNVLANVLGKTPKYIFREFDDSDIDQNIGRGDVKYHLGYNNEWTALDGEKSVHLSLCFNPSHLEFVNPVAMGRMRAKLDRFHEHPRGRGLTLLIHGDAAFAGEGIIQETLNMSQLPGYEIGGTIHVIVNNQVGFTTRPEKGRSGTYATDVAKMLQIPIFHVNGEDPEAVAQVVSLAMDFRSQFSRDVVIDMYCYRRRGHNEGDEPAFTEPTRYRHIRAREGVRKHYLQHLLKMGEVTSDEAQGMEEAARGKLEGELSSARSKDYKPRARRKGGIWAGYVGGNNDAVAEPQTSISEQLIQNLGKALTSLPADFNPHPKIKRILSQRSDMALGKRPVDWAMAEAFAFGSLLLSGSRVRMTGQDCERGTFSHRHSVLHDFEDGHEYMPLRHLDDEQAPIDIINSPLNEAGVLGFEYGYSLDSPDTLVLWEAQFGDFCNAAQVIIDQFIVSAEDKWRRLSGLCLLLPHGFEGMGPEHSSARLERFLALAAEDNIQVMNLTTPAQYFHVLRRQVIRPWRKPLIIMTPKSLLRHPAATSSLADFTESGFQKVIADPLMSAQKAKALKRVLLCSGKIFYELSARREELGVEDIAICRMEQYYPLPKVELEKAFESVPDGTPVFWVQEEPENMGAWKFLRYAFGRTLMDRLPFESITRPESASPATGSAGAHKVEQNRILSRALDSQE